MEIEELGRTFRSLNDTACFLKDREYMMTFYLFECKRFPVRGRCYRRTLKRRGSGDLRGQAWRKMRIGNWQEILTQGQGRPL